MKFEFNVSKFLLLAAFSALLMLTGCSGSSANNSLKLADSIVLKVADTSRTFIYTNKKYSQYYGHTNEYFRNTFEGWTYREKHVFSDYEISVAGKRLNREKSAAAVYPYMLQRKYADGVGEELLFPDNIDCLMLDLSDLPAGDVDFKIIGITGGVSVTAAGDGVQCTLNSIQGGKKLYVISNEKVLSFRSPDSSSVGIRLKNTGSIKIVLYISDNIDAASAALSDYNKLKEEKAARLSRLLNDSFVRTNDAEFDKALMWAKVSLDALITVQDMKGIFAGLPWFNSYWGRDSFISLPGAALVTGNYSEAREILLQYAEWQDKDAKSRNFGRIPNRITLNERIYNTADATPLFVYQCYTYFNYSSDTEFLKQIYPVIKTAFDGALKNYVDQQGFLTHGDAETWMDAVGKNGPYSPRGNRAVDIQALWYKQLFCTAEIAGLMRDRQLYDSAVSALEKLKSNFEKNFVDAEHQIIYDRIAADGRPDKSLRPNLFFAINEPDLFSSSLLRLKILGNVTGKLVAPYGVFSLAYTDSRFHKYHQQPELYHKDEAYHNGTIWQWLSGPVVQALCGFVKPDMAWVLTEELTRQILSSGTAGSLAELMDAMPRDGKKQPALSGTGSQAWSLAEYIRNFYQDYLGVKVDASGKTVYLLPTLPKKLNYAEFIQRIGSSDRLKMKYTFNDNIYRIDIDASGITDSLDVGIGLINRAEANYQMKFSVKKDQKVTVQVPSHSNSLKDLVVMKDGTAVKVSSQIYNEPPVNAELYERIKFAEIK